jgi:glycosyltransferase involved in cell wall biosynthesis
LHRFPPEQIFQLRDFVNAQGIDVIHTHMSRAHFMGVLLRGLCGTPCIATAHCRKIQAHWLLNHHVIATSRDTERFHRRYNWVPRHKISTIYSPAPQRQAGADPASTDDAAAVQSLRAAWGCPPRTQSSVVGVVGEISPAKGQLHLLHAVDQLRRAGREVHVAIIGNHRQDYVQHLQTVGRDLGIGHLLHWPGFCHNVPLAMRAMDVYVCPSLSESLPLTILEAMAASRPIIATRVGGIPEIIRDRRTGLLVPARDASALATALTEVLDSPALARQLGADAWQKLQEDFDPRRQTERIEQVYRRYVAAANEAKPRAAA